MPTNTVHIDTAFAAQGARASRTFTAQEANALLSAMTDDENGFSSAAAYEQMMDKAVAKAQAATKAFESAQRLVMHSRPGDPRWEEYQEAESKASEEEMDAHMRVKRLQAELLVKGRHSEDYKRISWYPGIAAVDTATGKPLHGGSFHGVQKRQGKPAGPVERAPKDNTTIVLTMRVAAVMVAIALAIFGVTGVVTPIIVGVLISTLLPSLHQRRGVVKEAKVATAEEIERKRLYYEAMAELSVYDVDMVNKLFAYDEAHKDEPAPLSLDEAVAQTTPQTSATTDSTTQIAQE